jgi:hypothetical protein
MRADKHLDTSLDLTSRQLFFLSCWFNMVHQSSLDSYRVRVMNPLNILRELRKMYEPHADEADRRRVGEEAIEILGKHPVLEGSASRFPALEDTLALLNDAVAKSKKEGASSDSTEKAEHAFKKNGTLIHSFVNQLEAALRERFLSESFDWLDAALTAEPVHETPKARRAVQTSIERVCRDILSVSHDDGFSLESLFQIYRLMVREPSSKAQAPAPGVAEDAAQAYDFLVLFRRVRELLVSPQRTYRVVFVIRGASAQASMFHGTYDRIRISDQPHDLPADLPTRALKRYMPHPQRLFADATVQGRDGRSAGMSAFRQIGQILDLMRFEYDSRSLELDNEFLLIDEDEQIMLPIPQLIPNPEADPPTRKLEEFVQHLNGLAGRDGTQTESRDRIFAAFRLYRVGSDAPMFENKLVNWWTGIEYLTKGGKSAGGQIGPSVEAALAPTLGLIYFPKHLAAFRSMLAHIGAELTVEGTHTKVDALSNEALFRILKDPAQHAELEQACNGWPYLWHHLEEFIDTIAQPAKILAVLKAHERRVRWQIQRIYRARCDIVHSGQQVVMAGLLCANLEYYLRMTLKSMLRAFQEVSTMKGAGEFFERRKHQYDRVMKQLDGQRGSDALLIETLNG